MKIGGGGDVGQGTKLWLWSLNKSRDLVQNLMTMADNIIPNNGHFLKG